MSTMVLQTFYQRMMPLFTPQAEKILDTIPPEKLNDLAFRYTFSVGTDERYYEGFYTFKADAAYQILSILHQIYPEQVPAPPSPDFSE